MRSLLALIVASTAFAAPKPAPTPTAKTGNMQVELTATRRVSTFILEEKIPPALGESTELAVAVLEEGDAVTHEYRLSCRRRGEYQLGPLVAKWGDPFGLTRRAVELAEPVSVLVHPAVEEVQDRPLTRMFEEPPMRPPISRPWPTGMEFYGMRQYAPGDDVRRVIAATANDEPAAPIGKR